MKVTCTCMMYMYMYFGTIFFPSASNSNLNDWVDIIGMHEYQIITCMSFTNVLGCVI